MQYEDGGGDDEKAKKKGKKKNNDENQNKKAALNRLDVLENTVAQTLQLLQEKELQPKPELIATMRRKLLEFLFRGCSPMTVPYIP